MLLVSGVAASTAATTIKNARSGTPKRNRLRVVGDMGEPKPRTMPAAVSSSAIRLHDVSKGTSMYSKYRNGWKTAFHPICRPRNAIASRTA